MPVALDVTLGCDAVGEVLVVSGWIEEALSRPTRASLLVLGDAPIEAADALGQDATVEMASEDGERSFELVVTGVRMRGQRSGRHLHEIELAHPIVKLARRAGYRYWAETSTADVVKQIVDEHGIQPTWQPDATTKHVYLLQYRESDFDLVSRLCEDDGVYFVCDEGVTFLGHDSSLSPIDGDDAIPLVAGDARGASITTFAVEHRAGPDGARLLDWNEETPHLDLGVQGVIGDEARALVTEFPARFRDFAQGGARLAARLAALAAQRLVAEGESTCMRLAAGRTFRLTESSRSADEAWLIRRVRHEFRVRGLTADERAGYSNELEASPAARPYAPQRTTPWPIAPGHDVVEVVGPSGQEIHTDALGRIQAWYHWEAERAKSKDERWIRVLQPAIGGSMFLPRVGWKMAVVHVAGDPTRPVAIGRLDHVAHPPAYPQPAEKTKSTLRTLSSPGGDKHTEIRLEDKAGEMELHVHAAKDWDEKVLHDKTETVGKDETVTVGEESLLRVDKTQTITVGKNRTSKVLGTDLLRVVGDRTAKIDASETVAVTKNEHVKIAGKDEESVGATYTLTAKHEVVRTAKGKYVLQVGAAAVVEAGSTFTHAVAGARTTTIGGAWSTTVSEGATETTQGDLTTTIGAVSMQNAMGKRIASSDGKTEITVGGVAALTAAAKAQIKAKKIKITVGGAANLTGGGAILNVTPASVAMVGMVTVKASGDVVVTGKPNLAG